MEPTELESLIGASPDRIETLNDYGYRAAWKVTSAVGSFLVKKDARPDFQRYEIAATKDAAAAGAPVAELVASCEEPTPTAAWRWIPGAPLHGQHSEDAWRNAGRSMRLAHTATPMKQLEPEWNVTALFEESLPYLVDRRGLTADEANSALDHLRGNRELLESTPLVWLHGDCQAAHFIMDPTANRVAGIIDWSDAQLGDPVWDFAVLSMFDDGVLELVLDGYDATAEVRDALPITLPIYQAVRAASSARWLDEHGYPGHEWPLDLVRRLIYLS